MLKGKRGIQLKIKENFRNQNTNTKILIERNSNLRIQKKQRKNQNSNSPHSENKRNIFPFMNNKPKKFTKRRNKWTDLLRN